MPCWTLVLHSTSTCFASLHLPLTTATSRAVASLDFYKIFSRGIPKKKDKPCQEEEVKEVVAEEVAAEVVAAEVVAAACRRWTPSLIVLGTCCAERLQLPLYRTFFLLKYCIIKPLLLPKHVLATPSLKPPSLSNVLLDTMQQDRQHQDSSLVVTIRWLQPNQTVSVCASSV